MAAASSSVTFFSIREEEQQFYNTQQQQHLQQQQSSMTFPSSAAAAAATPPAAPPKKKRNLPGNPNPDAEVIALSPKALLATNRFICEVCNKGFQREQNLQLHRRGHNLPWKLKQKNPKEVRRRVYICPEPTCVHHDPSRALGDLTGIKKHFCRKHGEKKWKCDKCSKRYAVQSDWKAHSKTCGTREYRCDCGTLFSRRDSFITHRAFCDALAQEGARINPASISSGIGSHHLYANSTGINLSLPPVNSQFSSLQDQAHASNDLLRLGGNGQFDHLSSMSAAFRPPPPPQSTASSPFYLGGGSSSQEHHHLHGLMAQDLQANAGGTSAPPATNLFNLNIFSGGSSRSTVGSGNNLLISDQLSNAAAGEQAATAFAGSLMSNQSYNHSDQSPSMPPHMSATALLQKAAQMGATSSCSSSASCLLRGFGSLYSSSTTAAVAAGGMENNANFRGAGESSSAEAQNERHFQDLMDSIANEQETGFNAFSCAATTAPTTTSAGVSMIAMNEQNKLQRNVSASDRLSTRDFLGVGSMMRSMGGGGGGITAQREQHLGIGMGSLDSEPKPASSTTRSFVGGDLQ